MNKSESKYYNTALLMDQALIELLNKKDFEYITIKEICEKAGVNRTTFYLHYETINDLLSECIDNINKHFIKQFNKNTVEFFEKIKNCSNEELILITPEYLTPYLNSAKIVRNHIISCFFINAKSIKNWLKNVLIKSIKFINRIHYNRMFDRNLIDNLIFFDIIKIGG